MSGNLEQLITDSVEKPPDSVRDNAIVAELRKMKAETALLYIKAMIVRRSPSALPVAMRVLNDSSCSRELFEFCLPEAQAGEIKILLEFGIKKIGTKAVVAILAKKNTDIPRLVEKALYWLPSLVEPKDQALVESLKETS